MCIGSVIILQRQQGEQIYVLSKARPGLKYINQLLIVHGRPCVPGGKITFIRDDGCIYPGIFLLHVGFIQPGKASGGICHAFFLQGIVQLGGAVLCQIDSVTIQFTQSIAAPQSPQPSKALPQGELIRSILFKTGHKSAGQQALPVDLRQRSQFSSLRQGLFVRRLAPGPQSKQQYKDAQQPGIQHMSALFQRPPPKI